MSYCSHYTEYKVSHSLLYTGLQSHRPVSVFMMSTTEITNNEHIKHRAGLHHLDGQVRVQHLPGEHIAPGCTVWFFGQMFCWETSGPVVYVDASLTHTTYLCIAATNTLSLKRWPDSSGSCALTQGSWAQQRSLFWCQKGGKYNTRHS